MERSFKNWLYGETSAARCALLAVYEQRDMLRYIEGPQLEREYMEKLGNFEQIVIKEEIECELLKKKQQLVQAAINRREPIDESAIDAQLDQERQEKLREAAGEAMPEEFRNLSPEEGDELQKLYREIVRDFHPEMHPELSQVHRELFKKAHEAYRRRDLDSLKLIHEMLNKTEESGLTMELMVELLSGGEENVSMRDYTTDYALVSIIYSAFKATAEEATIKEECAKYQQKAEDAMREIETMRSEFPYTAAEMLSAPEKVADYKAELELRLRNATAERERRRAEIRQLIESVEVDG